METEDLLPELSEDGNDEMYFNPSKERCTQQNQKAIKVLGRDPSLEKVMNTLGMDKEELKRAELEQKQRTEQYYARERSKSSGAINKRDSAKALGVLGHDPSRAKIIQKLGVGEEELLQMEDEEKERVEQQLDRRRALSATAATDKKHSMKALDVLGHDPSLQKCRNRLGMDDDDLNEAKQEKDESYELAMEKKRTNSWVDKRNAQKAIKVLGLDPSLDKVSDVFGLEPEEAAHLTIPLGKNGSSKSTPANTLSQHSVRWLRAAFTVALIVFIWFYFIPPLEVDRLGPSSM